MLDLIPLHLDFSRVASFAFPHAVFRCSERRSLDCCNPSSCSCSPPRVRLATKSSRTVRTHLAVSLLDVNSSRFMQPGQLIFAVLADWISNLSACGVRSSIVCSVCFGCFFGSLVSSLPCKQASMQSAWYSCTRAKLTFIQKTEASSCKPFATVSLPRVIAKSPLHPIHKPACCLEL